MAYSFIFLVVLVVSSMVYILIKLRGKSRLLQDENIRIKNQIKLLENEQLKFQLQPHTVKNILANLRLFAKKLNQGMDTLSDTLDYVLYKGQNNYVSVEEELDFIKGYLKLNDLFIQGIDCIQVDESGVDKTSFYYRNACLPHLISAYFIENAFKHGDTAHKDFLRIDIELNDSFFKLLIVNKVFAHVSPDRKGIGLSNMRKRLEFLSKDKHKVSFGLEADEYRAELQIYFDQNEMESRDS
jgi:LytS/YehU family sensor histidine kinase